MIQRPQPYKRQIYLCINNRHGESPSCGYSGGEEIAEELKKMAKEMNLKVNFASPGAAALTSVPSVRI